MPATSATTSEPGFAVDAETHTIRFERDLACSPQEAFAAWTKPEQIGLWWDPTGEPLTTCEIDLRVGGGFTFISRSHPDMPFVGSYREIAAPTRLAFDAMGSAGRVLFEASGSGTRMTVEIRCQSEAQLAQFMQMGVAAGTSQTLDNLVAFIARA